MMRAPESPVPRLIRHRMLPMSLPPVMIRAACCALTALTALHPAALHAADPSFDPLDDAAALETAPADVGRWSGAFAFGLLATTGNTHSGNVSGNGALDYLRKRGDNRFTVSYLDAWAREADTDHKLLAEDKGRVNLGRSAYAFALAHYDEDAAAAVTRRISLSAGFGRHLAAGAQQLDLDAGAGWSHSRDHDVDDFDDHAIGVAGLDYRWTIGPNSLLRETAQGEFSQENVYLSSVTSLQLKLVASWFVSLDYEWRHNRRAPAGTAHTDDIRSVSVGWQFGAQTPAPGMPVLVDEPAGPPRELRR